MKSIVKTMRCLATAVFGTVFATILMLLSGLPNIQSISMMFVS
jgi:hypothetical protein